MSLDRLFKLSVVFLAGLVAVMLLLSVLAAVAASAGSKSGPRVVHAKRIAPPAHQAPTRQR